VDNYRFLGVIYKCNYENLIGKKLYVRAEEFKGEIMSIDLKVNYTRKGIAAIVNGTNYYNVRVGL
jgi:hypothetical protein